MICFASVQQRDFDISPLHQLYSRDIEDDGYVVLDTEMKRKYWCVHGLRHLAIVVAVICTRIIARREASLQWHEEQVRSKEATVPLTYYGIWVIFVSTALRVRA